jgi:glycerol-3-phosphate dehydrogenase (NAD+)
VKGHRVTIVMQDSEQEWVDAINKTHRNPSCFPERVLHPFLVSAATEKDIAALCKTADYVVCAIPVQFTLSYLSKHRDSIKPDTPIICVSKVPASCFLSIALAVYSLRSALSVCCLRSASCLTTLYRAQGIDAKTLNFMSEIIPMALQRDQPRAFLAGPSFAKEMMLSVPTCVTVAAVLSHSCSASFYLCCSAIPPRYISTLSTIYVTACVHRN